MGAKPVSLRIKSASVNGVIETDNVSHPPLLILLFAQAHIGYLNEMVIRPDPATAPAGPLED